MNSRQNFGVLIITVLAVITGCASQVIQLIPNEKESVREEQSKYGVTCFGPNLQEFQWRGPKGIISQSSQFRVHTQELAVQRNQTGLMLVFEKVREEDEGSYACTAIGRNEHSNIYYNNNFKLIVTKKLEFDSPTQQTTDEYSNYFVKCNVKGNINPTFMWSFGDQTFKERTSSEKYSVQEGGLLIRNVTHLDAGKYTCRAFETTSKSSVSDSRVIDLKVRHKPLFLNHMEGDPVNVYVLQSDSVNLTCENSAEPAASMIWSFNGKHFVHSDNHYIVTFTRLEKLGLYECTAANTLGRITRRFNLIEGFKPKTPSNLTAARVGDNYIELQVAPNDKEDELIGYRIEYLAKVVEPDGKTYESYNVINFNTTEGPFTLINLKPNTEYITKILARNRAGNSNFTQPYNVRTLQQTVGNGGVALPFDGFIRQIVIAVALFAARL